VELNDPITVVTKMTYLDSSIVHRVSAVVGSFDEVRDHDIAFTLEKGETRRLWLSALILPFIPVPWWYVYITNLGDGAYRVRYPWALRWISHDPDRTCQAVKPSTITGRTKYVAVVG
jgi:hypothetical protein